MLAVACPSTDEVRYICDHAGAKVLVADTELTRVLEPVAAEAPAIGEEVDTPEGLGTVVGHNVPSESVVVRMTADGRRTPCALASVCASRKAYEASPAAQRTDQ